MRRKRRRLLSCQPHPVLFLLLTLGLYIRLHLQVAQHHPISSSPHHDDEAAVAVAPLLEKNQDQIPAAAWKNITSTGPVVKEEADVKQQDFLVIPPRAFSSWPANKTLPCFDPNEHDTLPWRHRKVRKSPTQTGLLFLKLLKTASSTAASVHTRVARNVAARQQPTTSVWSEEHHNSTPLEPSTTPFELCQSRFSHGWAGPRMYRFGERDRSASFLWSLLREPTARYVSEFFHFEVSRAGVNATDDAAFVQFLQQGRHADHHSLSWLSTTGYRKGKDDPLEISTQILNEYDFLGVTERFDESMVVLGLLLHVPLGDLLYLSSKSSGGYDDGEYQNRCVHIQPSHLTPGMQDYLQSSEWKDYMQPELDLYRTVDASLDLTIERLGKDHVASNLRIFQQAQQQVQEQCVNVTKFPCAPTGQRRANNETDCMWSDVGCGMDCLDRVASSLNLT